MQGLVHFWCNTQAREDSQGNPSQVIFRAPSVLEVPGAFGNNQSCDASFAHVDSSNGFTRIFIVYENVPERCVVTSAGELGTTSKSNLRAITVGIV